MTRRITMNRVALPAGAAAGGLVAAAFLPVAIAFADNLTGTAGDAGSLAPIQGLGSSLASAGNAANTTPLGSVGDTGSTAPIGGTNGLGSATPIGNTGGTTPIGDAGGTTPGGEAPGITPVGTTPGGEAPGITPVGTTPGGEAPGITPVGTTPGGETPGITPPGDVSGAHDAFTLGNYTFDPVQADGSEGYNPVSSLFGAPPYFDVGQGTQTFDITGAAGSGASNAGSHAADAGSHAADAGGSAANAGSGATDLGQITTSEDVSNMLGIHNTEFTVDKVDPASGVSASELPAQGSVYDVANFGNGYENIYSDIPGSGSAGNSISDTMVTPFGNYNIPTHFDAIAGLKPGDALGGVDLSTLGSGGGSAADTLGNAAGGATDAAGNAGGGAADAAGHAAGGATDALGNAAGGATDAAGNAAGGAADAAGGAADAAGNAAAAVDPLDFLGL